MGNDDELEAIRARFQAGRTSDLDVEVLIAMADVLIARLAELGSVTDA